MSKGQIVLRVVIVMIMNMILTIGICIGLLFVLKAFDPDMGIAFVCILAIAMLAVVLMTPASNYYYKAKDILQRRKRLGTW